MFLAISYVLELRQVYNIIRTNNYRLGENLRLYRVDDGQVGA